MRPMLAQKVNTAELGGLKYPLFVSPKLDGVRALIINGQLVSRTLKPIPNKATQSLFAKEILNGFDGELIVGKPTDPNCYNKTVSGVMAEEGSPIVRFFVFDNFLWDSPFRERLDCLKEILAIQSPQQNVFVVPQILVEDEEQLLAYEKDCLQKGYEGIMIRSLNSPYKQGRSTLKEGWLLKLKRFLDSEAVILGFEELEQNTNTAKTNALGLTERSHSKAGKIGKGILGAFLVRDIKTNVEFSVGSGLTLEQRTEFYKIKDKLLGKLIKYKYFPVGEKDKPRFPTFLGFRNPIDL